MAAKYIVLEEEVIARAKYADLNAAKASAQHQVKKHRKVFYVAELISAFDFSAATHEVPISPEDAEIPQGLSDAPVG